MNLNFFNAFLNEMLNKIKCHVKLTSKSRNNRALTQFNDPAGNWYWPEIGELTIPKTL